jgi:hypothetical protein
MTGRFEKALAAVKSARRDAEKEATRLEITQPELAAEARERANSLSDARTIMSRISDLSITLAAMENEK